jgi:hypothetical protein
MAIQVFTVDGTGLLLGTANTPQSLDALALLAFERSGGVGLHGQVADQQVSGDMDSYDYAEFRRRLTEMV